MGLVKHTFKGVDMITAKDIKIIKSYFAENFIKYRQYYDIGGCETCGDCEEAVTLEGINNILDDFLESKTYKDLKEK